MTATTATIDRTSKTQPARQSAGSFCGDLYRFHGFKVFDRDGERVGIVDWIWTNDTSGEGDHIGLQLQWLRGRARAVPATEALVDPEHAIVRLPFAKRQISGARRFRIDRALPRDDRVAIAAHFAPAIGELSRRSLSAPHAA